MQNFRVTISISITPEDSTTTQDLKQNLQEYLNDWYNGFSIKVVDVEEYPETQ